MQASAPLMSCRRESGYERKSFTITTLSFGLLVTEGGSSRRESAMMDVMEVFWRHCSRISRPMKPVQPVRMIFILRGVVLGLEA